MMRWLIAMSIVFLPAVALAQFTIGTVGDLQIVSSCGATDTIGIDRANASFNWIIAQGNYDVVLSAGDLVMESDVPVNDCDCLAQSPAPCDQYSSKYQAECNTCADPEAMACNGGTAGEFCSWSRIRNWFDGLESAGIPWMISPGNHDMAANLLTVGSWWEPYKDYFGSVSAMTSLVTERGLHIFDDDGVGSFIVVTKDDIDWLFISIPYVFYWENEIIQPYLDWIESVLRSHPGKPTTVITHAMMNPGGIGAVGACGDDLDEVEAGFCFFPSVAEIWYRIGQNPKLWQQVWMLYGQHFRCQHHDLQVHPDTGYPILAWTADLMTWVPVFTMRVDPLGGKVGVTTYTAATTCAGCPKMTDNCDVTTDCHWQEEFRFCGSPRFDLPKSACQIDGRLMWSHVD